MVDQYWEKALFQDLGSAPATMEAARTCIMHGLMPGNEIMQADAMQAYVQARLKGTETWVEIPEEGWPETWIKYGPPVERLCCRLIRALYGHLDPGTFWEQHADKELKKIGFEPVDESLPSCCYQPEKDIYLVVYVDDFLMSGPKENFLPMWEKIGEVLNIEPPEQMGLYLGCLHSEFTEEVDGVERRVLEFNQESFFKDKLDNYIESYTSAAGEAPKLSKVTTPYFKESPKDNAARKPEDNGEDAIMCKDCRHAFAWKTAVEVEDTGGRVFKCPWCHYAFTTDEALPVTSLAGQISKTTARSKAKPEGRIVHGKGTAGFDAAATNPAQPNLNEFPEGSAELKAMAVEKAEEAEEIIMKVAKLNGSASLPTKGTSEAAGWDLRADRKVTITPGKTTIVPTGLVIELPEGTYGRIASRSGLSLKKGIEVHAGVIDEDYRGEIKVLLFNHGEEEVRFQTGDKVAQMIVESCQKLK